jgi:hypothetical protein
MYVYIYNYIRVCVYICAYVYIYSILLAKGCLLLFSRTTLCNAFCWKYGAPYVNGLIRIESHGPFLIYRCTGFKHNFSHKPKWVDRGMTIHELNRYFDVNLRMVLTYIRYPNKS